MRSFMTTVTALSCFLVLLTSCGGGSATPGGGINSPAPSVSSMSPSANTTGVSVGSTVSAVFDKDMNASTINNSTFYIRKTGTSTNVAGTVSYNAGSRTALFAPSQTLLPGTSYTATITAGVQTSYGISMAAPATWSFSTSAAATYTISGTISNLNGTVVLQNNGGDTLTLSRTAGGGNTYSGSFTFQNRVSDGGGYSVTVATQPADAPQTCSVSNGAGTVNLANVADITINCVNTVGPLYANGSNWNDYVRNDGTSRFSALNTACTGTEMGGYPACIHGGEVRTVEATGKTSCTGLTAQDALGAFNWMCVQTAPYVKFVSTGLRENKFLSDLIDFTTPAWKENVVTLSDGGTFLTTPSAVWWNNPVIFDNDGGGPSTAGTVFLVTQQPPDASSWYVITRDSIAMVIKPGIVLQGMNGSYDAVTFSNSKFGWFEGELRGAPTGGNNGLKFDRVKFSVVRKLGVRNAHAGLSIGDGYTGNDNNLIMNVIAAENNTGIDLSLGNYNTLANIVATNNNGDGISVFTSTAYNTMINVTSSNNSSGINLGYPTAHDIVMLNVTAANNGVGMYYSFNGNNNLLVNTAAINNSSTGISVWMNSVNNKFLNVASAHNVYLDYTLNCPQSYQISVIGEPNTFDGLLKIGTVPACSTRLCNATPPGSGIDSSCQSTGNSTSTLVTGVTVTNIFVGKVASDATNTTDSGGTAAFDTYAIDWLHFDNAYRGWGRDGNAFPDQNNTSTCMSVSGFDACRIWDWSMQAADTQVRGVLALPTGNDVAVHTWSAATSADCAAVTGAAWNGATCTTTFLKNAVEVLGDGIGNENGLCESAESCLYTPNIGSYQGHGSLASAGAFTNGTLTGISLLRQSTNGY